MKNLSSILNQPLRMMKETFTPRSYDESHFEMDWTLEAGGAVPPHQHRYMDEHFTVTEGEATFTVNYETVVKQVGETLLVPRGTRHGITNKTKSRIGLKARYSPCADTHKFFAAMSYFSENGQISMGGMFKAFYVQKKLGWKPFSEAADAGGAIMFGLMNGIGAVCGVLGGWSKYLKEFEQ